MSRRRRADEARAAMLTALEHSSPSTPWQRVVADAMVSSLEFPEDDLEALRLRLR